MVRLKSNVGRKGLVGLLFLQNQNGSLDLMTLQFSMKTT